MLTLSGSLNWTGRGQCCDGQKGFKVGMLKLSVKTMHEAVYANNPALSVSAFPSLLLSQRILLRASEMLEF